MCRAQTDREMVYLLEIKVQRDGFFKPHHCGCTSKYGSTINTRHAKCAGGKKKDFVFWLTLWAEKDEKELESVERQE